MNSEEGISEFNDGNFNRNQSVYLGEEASVGNKQRKFLILLFIISFSGCLALAIWVYLVNNKYQDTAENYQESEVSWTKQNNLLNKELDALKKSYDKISLENINLREQRESPVKSNLLDSLIQENYILREKLAILERDKLYSENDAEPSEVVKEKLNHLEELVKKLETELQKTRNQYTKLFDQHEDLKTKFDLNKQVLTSYHSDNEALKDRITKAAKIDITKLELHLVKTTSNNEHKERSKLKYSDDLQICFTIEKNKLSIKQHLDIYIKIEDENGHVLHQREPTASIFMLVDNFDTYSLRKNVPYENESKDVCMYYNLSDQNIKEGNYLVKVLLERRLEEQKEIELK